jgi:hypothetical protein
MTSGLTLDVHEGAQLDAARVVVHAVDAGGAEDGLHERPVKDALDLGTGPVVPDSAVDGRSGAGLDSDGVAAREAGDGREGMGPEGTECGHGMEGDTDVETLRTA